MGTRHALAWKARPDAVVLTVFDPIPERGDRLASETGAIACGTYQEAILHHGVRCVSVATPAAFHAPVACFAAEHHRHVLSEKPLSLTLEQAKAMQSAAREGGVLLAVSFQYRSFARNRKLRELCLTGEFGGPIFARYTDVREVRPKTAMHSRSLNGGPVIDMVGHYVDLMRFITGTEPVRVSANGHIYGRGRPRLAEVHDFAVDAASLEVGYKNGHTLSVFANWGMPEGFPGYGEEYLIGPQLSARAAGSHGLDIQYPDRLVNWRPVSRDDTGPVSRISDLVNAIEGRGPLEVSGDDGVIALGVCLAALESIETGRTVLL
jgi:predicted dehydrogenase